MQWNQLVILQGNISIEVNNQDSFRGIIPTVPGCDSYLGHPKPYDLRAATNNSFAKYVPA